MERSAMYTPMNQLTAKQLTVAASICCIGGMVAGFLVTVVFLLSLVYSADDLAHQVANGTHRIEYTTNELGTLEVRIVEVEQQQTPDDSGGGEG